MTDLLQIGPLVFAADRAIAALAVVAFLGGTRWWRGTERTDAQNTATLAVVVGAIAARAAYVAGHASSYLAEPWSALYVWQGGFEPVAGVVAAAAVLLLRFGTTRQAVAPVATLAVLAAASVSVTAMLEHRAVRAWPDGLVVLSIDGDRVSLEAFAGRPFVVNLWATWCPPCRREMPLLAAVASERPDVPVLLVNQGEATEVVAAYLDDARLQHVRVLLDEGGTIGGALDARALPTTVFVDAHGIIRRRHYGEISRAALESGLREIGGPPASESGRRGTAAPAAGG